MGILGALFFVIIPLVLLGSIEAIGRIGSVSNVSAALDALPAQAQIRGTTPAARTQYALAVYLFAPLAVIVPLTISSAVGAAALVGDPENGPGEFLAHSPLRPMRSTRVSCSPGSSPATRQRSRGSPSTRSW